LEGVVLASISRALRVEGSSLLLASKLKGSEVEESPSLLLASVSKAKMKEEGLSLLLPSRSRRIGAE